VTHVSSDRADDSTPGEAALPELSHVRARAEQPCASTLLEPYRVELNGYCYRMLGSAFETEDAVQETLVRAWRSYDQFEGRASVRSWLYRIATNVCLTMVGARQRRARPMDLGPAWSADNALGAALDEATWLEPVPDGLIMPSSSDPSEQMASRETVRLAFVAALQLLPAKQRAALILHEVLHWRAAEVADLLGTSVASINSALQRARATLAAHQPRVSDTTHLHDDTQRELLGRYVDAFERWDVDSLVALLHEEVVLQMPPFALWLHGPEQLQQWFLGAGAGCRGSRLLRVSANGCPAFAQYKPNEHGERVPFALHVIETVDGRIVGHNSFLDVARIFPLFGLPLTEPARGA
jgi:RNA polymerase sigma-70 factor (ECF subfamily)